MSKFSFKALVWYLMSAVVIGMLFFGIVELSTLEPTFPVMILSFILFFALLVTLTVLILRIVNITGKKNNNIDSNTENNNK